jgi:hypothetical protein
MKNIISLLKKHRSLFLTLVAVASIALLIINAVTTDYSQFHVGQVLWVAIGLIIGEILFIVGALLMAYSVGENVSHFGHIRRWRQALIYLRKHARRFGETLIVSRSFTVGFWMNFAGAVITSLILIIAIVAYNPYAGAGILLVLVIDLIATFGWRIPIEIARRKVRQNAN